MKKFLALAVACVMLVCAFASCGNNPPAQTGENPASTGAATDDQPGVTGGTIKLGGIGPTTGAAATYGNAVKNGMMLAVDEINAAGGINGMKVVAEFQDDEHNPEKAVNAYNTLVDHGMQALIGTVTSAPCVAVKAEALVDNMFMLTPSGSAVASISDAPNAFRVCFSDPDQGIGAADYIAENNLGTMIAVIYNSSDVYSSGIYEKFAAEAQVKGLNIVTTQAFTDDSANDFSVQLTAIKNAGADLVFLPIYYEAAALILEQANTLGMDVEYFGCDGLDGVIDQLADKASLAEGVMLLTPFAADAQDEKTQKFTAAYKAAYNNEIPNQFAADAYDAVYIVKAAIEKAGVTDASISASDLCDAMKTAMTQITVDGVTGTMTWNEEGEPTKSPKGMVISDGSYVAM